MVVSNDRAAYIFRIKGLGVTDLAQGEGTVLHLRIKVM